jgi:hypothetical protein
MSVYAVELVKQLVDCLVSQAVSPLVEAGSAIEQVEDWLEDDASRRQYRHFLAMWVAAGVLDTSRAVHYLGNFKVQERNALVEQMKVLLASGGACLSWIFRRVTRSDLTYWSPPCYCVRGLHSDP